MGIDQLKAALADVPGIDSLTMTTIGGRACYSFAGKIAAVDPNADDAEIQRAIRTASGSPEIASIIPTASVQAVNAKPAPGAPKLTAPATGSFAAKLKAMMADARAGVEQARNDGLSKVTDAVSKLEEAKAATLHVTGTMAKTIEDEAASVMSELGLISNDLTGEAQ